MIRLQRSPELTMSSSSAARSGWPSCCSSLATSWAVPMITVIGLFSSWATPAAISPKAASLADWISCPSIFIFSVTSLRMIVTADSCLPSVITG